MLSPTVHRTQTLRPQKKCLELESLTAVVGGKTCTTFDVGTKAHEQSSLKVCAFIALRVQFDDWPQNCLFTRSVMADEGEALVLAGSNGIVLTGKQRC